ncbi:MAG: hypothetical protein ACM3MK_09575 [Chitinophagales bacterium]
MAGRPTSSCPNPPLEIGLSCAGCCSGSSNVASSAAWPPPMNTGDTRWDRRAPARQEYSSELHWVRQAPAWQQIARRSLAHGVLLTQVNEGRRFQFKCLTSHLSRFTIYFLFKM